MSWNNIQKDKIEFGPYLDQYGRHPKIPLLHGIFETVTRLRPVLPSKTFVGYTNYHIWSNYYIFTNLDVLEIEDFPY